jgi:hypothetical protein
VRHESTVAYVLEQPISERRTTTLWGREAAEVRAPIELSEAKVEFGIGVSKAPACFRHQLVVHSVIELAVRHDGGYPFAQPVQAVTFDANLSEMAITLGFGSTLRIRVLEVGFTMLNGVR